MPSVFLSSDTSITATTQALVLPYPKVAVNFRPPNRYNGAFGFDWIRTGDTGASNGDTWYRDIIGSYAGSTFNQNTPRYSALLRKYDQVEHPTKQNDKYIVPVVALMKGKTAKFSIKLDVQVEPDILEFVFNEAYFSLNTNAINEKAVGTRSLVDHLEVSCIEEFDEDQTIEVLADGRFAGRLKFMANDRGHRAYKRIELVKVHVDLGNTGVVSIPSVNGEATNLRKFLRQSLTTAGIWTKELDLSTDVQMRTTHRLTHQGTHRVSKTTALATYLEQKFQDEFPDDSDHYKVFFFNERGGRFAADGSYVGLNGYAKDINSKSVVLFSSHAFDSTIHELLHAFGLYHSFDNSSEYTFEKKKTDNIMDYSHTASPPIRRKSTWYWQWKMVNRRIR